MTLGGGGSGGGSINIFYRTNIVNGNIMANGGARGTANTHTSQWVSGWIGDFGGNGGDGSITINNLSEMNVGKYTTPYIPEGFKYKEGTWNSGYTIIGDTVSTNNEFVWVPCVVNEKDIVPGDKVEIFKKTLPATINETDPDYRYNWNAITVLPEGEGVVDAEDSSVQAIEKSVRKYNGFYIAKYEAGIDDEVDNFNLENRKDTSGNYKPLSQPNKSVWNSITRTEAIRVSNNMVSTSDNVKSALISGAAWDTTLKWIVRSSDNSEENKGFDVDSTGKGNYSREIKKTGNYATNNIYDLAGNTYSRTTENAYFYGGQYVVSRGGSFYGEPNERPAATRDIVEETEDAKYDSCSFRVVLYKE